MLIASAAQRWLLQGGALGASWWWGALGIVAVGALLAAAWRQFDLKEVAVLVDRLGGTRDRFLTALTFAGSERDFEGLAFHECRAFLATENFARRVRVRLPFATRFLLVPAIALALLQWEARLAEDARRRAAEAAQREVGGTTQQLERLAKEIEKASDKAGDEELKRIAEQLKKSAEQLRAQNNGADDAAKAALRELSNLEQMLQQLQKPPAAATPEEMKQLAKSLAQNPATEKAAEALQAGQLADAAKELEDAAKQEPTKEEAEKTLREALDRLAAQRQLSEALQQLAKQAQPQDGESSEALQKLAQMLRQMGRQQQQGSSGQPGKPMTEEMLKKLLAALENMKFGEGQKPGENPDSKGGEGGQISIQSFAKSEGGPQNPDASQLPSGQPGSEKDTGTTETPFGKKESERGEPGEDKSLKGRLGEGESLSQLLPTAGDTSKSQRRYKELYDAMAPAAEEAIVQENIPLGSRFFIKRYFESIRPKE
jgi:tetratricopeptide (TPR) repeat protein